MWKEHMVMAHTTSSQVLTIVRKTNNHGSIPHGNACLQNKTRDETRIRRSN